MTAAKSYFKVAHYQITTFLENPLATLTPTWACGLAHLLKGVVTLRAGVLAARLFLWPSHQNQKTRPMKIFTLFILSACFASAQTSEIHFDVLRLPDGRELKNATVKPSSAAFAIVDFDGGGERIAFASLPPNVQSQLGYDPAKAQAELDRQAKIKADAKERFDDQQRATLEAMRDKAYRIIDDKICPVSEFAPIHGQALGLLAVI